jgi:hypothetical protein
MMLSELFRTHQPQQPTAALDDASITATLARLGYPAVSNGVAQVGGLQVYKVLRCH